MVYRVLGAHLCGGASINGPLKGYAFVFYFFFYFRKISKYIWPIRELFGLF